MPLVKTFENGSNYILVKLGTILLSNMLAIIIFENDRNYNFAKC